MYMHCTGIQSHHGPGLAHKGFQLYTIDSKEGSSRKYKSMPTGSAALLMDGKISRIKLSRPLQSGELINTATVTVLNEVHVIIIQYLNTCTII